LFAFGEVVYGGYLPSPTPSILPPRSCFLLFFFRAFGVGKYTHIPVEKQSWTAEEEERKMEIRKGKY
jgi:hypothetical protein